LDQQGLIVRRRGLGTFVVETPMMKDLSNNFGITAMVKEAGYAPESHPGTVRTEKASKQLTSAFPSLPEGTPIIVVDRIRTANHHPVVWSLDVVPTELVGATGLRGFDATRQSLYQFLADELSIRVVRGLAELHPVGATKDLAARLGVRRGSPLMRIIQTDYDTNSCPVLYSIEYHVPDAFVFLVNRMGPYR
jgi:GntR family transcriptional regulator